MSSDNKENRMEGIKERSKGYAIIVATAVTFIMLMFVSTAITLYFLGLSIDPSVMGTIESISQHHLSTAGWQVASSIIIAVNAIISVFAYYQFRRWFRLHNQNLAYKEKFRPKFWPLVGMGFMISGAFGVLGGFITVTHTTLQGLDPVSIYNALDSGSIYGILAVLIALPITGIIIVRLGPATYHYIEKWEKEHHLPDIPDNKKDSPTGSSDTPK